MTVLGVDWGRARVGVAVSDETERFARPLATVRKPSRAGAAAEVARLGAGEDVRIIVVGLPLNMDGTEGSSAASARAFARAAAAAAGRPVEMWDERLSSWEGVRLAREGGRRKVVDKDQAAACVILQSYLNSRRNKT
jgi:putative Holliday junction resolvase